MTFFFTSLTLGLAAGFFLSLSAISFHNDPEKRRIRSGAALSLIWFTSMYACLYNAVIAASLVIAVCLMLMIVIAAPLFAVIDEEGTIRLR